LGASKIKELIFNDGSAWTVDSSKDVKLESLQNLVASGITASGDLYLTNCPLLKHIDLSNSKFTGLYGLENCSKLEDINIAGTDISTAKVASGAPIKTMSLATPKGLYLSNLKYLTYNNAEGDTLTA
jgi:hypothetical protein